jgi:hypothetical protein
MPQDLAAVAAALTDNAQDATDLARLLEKDDPVSVYDSIMRQARADAANHLVLDNVELNDNAHRAASAYQPETPEERVLLQMDYVRAYRQALAERVAESGFDHVLPDPDTGRLD